MVVIDNQIEIRNGVRTSDPVDSFYHALVKIVAFPHHTTEELP